MRDLSALNGSCAGTDPTSGSTPNDFWTTRCPGWLCQLDLAPSQWGQIRVTGPPGPGRAASTDSSAWSAATDQDRSRPPARVPWTSTSCRSRRSPRCLRKRPLAYPFNRSSHCPGWSSCLSALSGVHGWTPGMVPHRSDCVEPPSTRGYPPSLERPPAGRPWRASDQHYSG